MSSELERLRQRNLLLEQQVKRLVKAEQTLYLSQRAFSRHVQRLDALNRFAIDSGKPSHPDRIFDRAATMLFELFPFDHFVGFRVAEGRLLPVSLRAAPGRVSLEEDRLWCLRRRELSQPASAAPVVIHGRAPEDHPLRPLFDALDEALSAATLATDPVTLVLPLSGEGALRGVIALRRLDARVSYHEELPGSDDDAFLGLMARQVGTALANAQLVADLQDSYQKLASAQEELVKQERLAALGELSAIVAHEVRNPLAAILNTVAAFKRTCRNGAGDPLLLRVLSEESERLNSIVADLIDFGRPASAVLRSHSLTELVRDAVGSALQSVPAPADAVRVEVVDPPATVSADARMIQQAVINLVVNALQATRPNGQVTIRLCSEITDHGAFARLDVSDTGPGIALDDQARVFQPFYTTRAAGTGLGLAIVKRFVDEHRGEVSLKSTPGEGSTFTIRLPVSREESPPAAVARAR